MIEKSCLKKKDGNKERCSWKKKLGIGGYEAKTKYKFVEPVKEDKVEPVTENKNLDLSLGNGEGGEGGNEMTNDANLLSQVLETPSSNNGQVVTAPSNTPNTTDYNCKNSKIPVPSLIVFQINTYQ